jgi:hypothetical protein
LDVRLFFTGPGESTATAEAICEACPLKVECAEYAIPITDLSGVWGGTTAKERGRIRQQRAQGDPLARCTLCLRPTAGALAGCDQPECTAKEIEIEAAWKRREDI